MKNFIHEYPRIVWFVVVLDQLLYGNGYQKMFILSGVIVYMVLSIRETHANRQSSPAPVVRQ